MQVDVGFSDIIYPKPMLLHYPCMFDMPQPRLLSYTPESMIAEKVHTMIVLGELNSRIKDYFDVWFLSRQFEFDGKRLLEAIAKTFDNRKVDMEMLNTSTIFASDFRQDQIKNVQWQSFVSRNDLDIAPHSFGDAMEEISKFIFPVLAAFKDKTQFTKHWNKIEWI